jgi:hypothetical protein
VATYEVVVPLAGGAEVGPHVRRALQEDVPWVLLAAVRKYAAAHVDTGTFLASLDAEAIQYPYMGDPQAVAVRSAVEWADYLEYGRSGFHLAARWGARGGRWLVSKRGTLYARVPFRHRTPIDAEQGASTWGVRQEMPQEVYARAVRLDPYETTHQTLQGFGDLYRLSRPYEMFRQAGEVLPYYLGQTVGYTWRASRYERMARVTVPTPGGGRHTAYMTWRTITPQSEGWWIPPFPPQRIFSRGLEEAAPIVSEILSNAARCDIDDAIDGTVKAEWGEA